MIANCFCIGCTCGADGKKDFKIEVEKELKKKEKLFCPNNQELPLKVLGYKYSGVGYIITSKHASGRTIAEKEKRRSTDFIQNTLPTLPLNEKRHFVKKFKNKGLM